MASATSIHASSGPPDVPADLAATPGDNAVALDWKDVKKASSYAVYRGTTHDGQAATPLASGLSTSSYTDTDVVNGTAYYYRVTATGSAGESAASEEVVAVPGGGGIALGTFSLTPGSTNGKRLVTPDLSSVVIKAVGQATERDWIFTDVGEGRVRITPASATHLALGVENGATADGSAVTVSPYAGTDAQQWVLQPVANGYTLAPANAPSLCLQTTGNANGSAVVVAAASGSSSQAWAFDVVVATSAPAPVTDLVATDGNLQIALDWSPASGAISYNLYRGLASGAQDPAPIAAGVTSPGYVDTDVQHAVTYFYVVEAVNTVGTSGPSNEASATAYDLSLAPTDLTATAGNESASVAWAPLAGATSYHVYRATAGGQGSSPVATVTTASYDDTGLVNGTTYTYAVQAVLPIGDSAVSAEVSVLPFDADTPPADLVAAAGNAEVSLTWSGITGATAYELFRSAAPDALPGEPLATLTATDYSDSDVVNGTVYTYAVRAVFGPGATVLSPEVSAVPFDPAFAPTGLSASASAAEVTLTWDAVPGAVSYSVFRGAALGEEDPVAFATTTSPDFTDNGLNNGATYFYTVQAHYPAGDSAMSAEVSATPLNVAIGDGTLDHAVAGPAPFNGLGGADYHLVKNWDFGVNGTVRNYTDMNSEFFYHDEFNTIGVGTVYGGINVSPDQDHAIYTDEHGDQPVVGQPYGPDNVPVPEVRSFEADSMKTYLVPLGGATTVKPDQFNVGAGSFMAQWALPRGGSKLGQDLIWETRVRMITPPYFWFAIWTAGERWALYKGAEMDVVEAFGYDNGGGSTNFDGRYWHSNSVGGVDAVNYSNWGNAMAGVGVTNFDAAQYHVWQWVYHADDSYEVYMDGILVQHGSQIWTLANEPDGQLLKMFFQFDATWGHTGIASVNKSLPATDLEGKYYEWDYSRVYLTKPAPTNFTATAGNASATLTWDAAPDATAYNVYRSTQPRQPGATPIYSGPATSFNDSGLSNGTVYYYKVEAVFGAEKSGAVEVTATPFDPAVAPAGLTAAAGDRFVSLNWTALPGATGYQIFRGTSAGTVDLLNPIGTTDQTAYTDSSLAATGPYYYQVRGVYPGGVTAPSAIANALPFDIGLEANGGTQKITLSWKAQPGATGYDLFRSATAGGQNYATPYASVVDTSFVDEPLTNGTTYYYTLQAKFSAAASHRSLEASAAPFDESVGGGTVDTGSTIQIQPAYGLGGDGLVLVKDWDFGTAGTITDSATLSEHFYYHDQFGTIAVGNIYGGINVAEDAATAINTPQFGAQPYVGKELNDVTDTNLPVVTVPNYSFEEPDLGDPTNFDGTAPYWINPTPNSEVMHPDGGDWSFYGYAGISLRGSALGAWYNAGGDQFAFLQGKPNEPLGRISVPVEIPASGDFYVELYAGKRNGEVQPVQVAIDGVPVGDPIVPDTVDWNKKTFKTAVFSVATPGTHVLSLSATEQTNETVFIDSVSLKAQPNTVPVPPVREFTTDTMKTFLVPLGGADTVKADQHNVGAGSFMAKFALPEAGAELGQDLVWETKVRMVTPPYFWFALWTAGQQWAPGGGPEMDLVETFGFDNGGGFTNFDGQYWHSDPVGGTRSVNYSSWPDAMASVGFNSFNATEWHTWTWVYRADNTYTAYLDGIEVQSGSMIWRYANNPTGDIMKMFFQFDATWGHSQIPSVNQPLDSSELAGKYYEFDYSRLYLSAPVVAPDDIQAAAESEAVALSWNAVPGATSYDVVRDGALIATVTEPSYVDAGLTNGQEYGYQVRSHFGSTKASDLSATVTAVPLPNAPGNFTLTSGNGQVSLAWDAVAGASGYNLYRGASIATIDLDTPIAVGLAGTTFVDTAVVNGTSYTYAVRTVEGGILSAPSSFAEGIPFDATQAPAGLIAAPGDGFASLSWQDVSGATGYAVYRGLSSGGQSATPVATTLAGVTEFGDAPLTNDTTYYYTVTAIFGSAETEASAEVSVTPYVPTVGGGDVNDPAAGPSASFGLGAGFTLVKNWDFGTTGTIKTAGDLSANFNFHDQTGSIFAGGSYGAVSVASDAGTAVDDSVYGPQPYVGGTSAAAGGTVDIVNGSFELPDVSNVAGSSRRAGADNADTKALLVTTADQPWVFATDSNCGVAYRTASYWGTNQVDGLDGDQYAFINWHSSSTIPGNISTTLELTAGTYVVKFSAAKWSWSKTASGATTQPLQISIDGVPLGSPIAPDGIEWGTYQSEEFSVEAGSHTVSFEATVPGPNFEKATLLDAVSLERLASPIPNVREITTDSMQTFLVPFDSTGVVDSDDHNVGSGAFTAQWSLPTGGSHLGQDVIWETRVRMATPPYFMFGLWAGTESGVGSRMNVVESYGYDNGGGDDNFFGDLWMSSSVGGTDNVDYGTNWGGYASGDASDWHVWTWIYRADDTFEVYLDGVSVQTGTLTWNDLSETGAPTMSFNFDGTWGRTDLGASMNQAMLSELLEGTYYEYDYSRVYLSDYLAPPSDVSTVGDDSAVTVSWTVAPGAVSYKVYRATLASGGDAAVVGTTAGTSFTETGLTNGETGYYLVRAVYAQGTSGDSAVVEGTPVSALLAPTGLAGTPSTGQITLTWNSVDGAASYNVYRSATPGGSSVTPYASGVAATSYADTNVTEGEVYYYQVSAVGVSESARSAELAVSALLPTPTIGDGTIDSPAVGPAPSLNGGAIGTGYTLVKNWDFGTNGTITNSADMSANFAYHDPQGSFFLSGSYGALTIAADSDTTVYDVAYDPEANPVPVEVIVENGGFELPSLSNVGDATHHRYYAPNGGTPPTDWTFIGDSGYTQTNTFWQVPTLVEGVQAAFVVGVPGETLGKISTPVSFPASGQYTMSFVSARRPGDGAQPIKVSVDGVQIDLDTPAATSFAAHTTPEFTVTAGSHTISLEATDSTAGGSTGIRTSFIDAVTIDPVATVAAGTAPVLANASFELPDVSNVDGVKHRAGADVSTTAALLTPTAEQPWTFVGAGVAYYDASYWGTYQLGMDGGQYAYINWNNSGVPAGKISTSADFAAGTYWITFKMAKWSYDKAASGAVTQPLQLRVDGVAVGSPITPTGIQWADFQSEPFTVSAGSHTLSLEATVSGNGTDKTALVDLVEIHSDATPVAAEPNQPYEGMMIAGADVDQGLVITNFSFEEPIVYGVDTPRHRAGSDTSRASMLNTSATQPWAFDYFCNAGIANFQSDPYGTDKTDGMDGVQYLYMNYNWPDSNRGRVNTPLTLAAGTYQVRFRMAKWSSDNTEANATTQPIEFLLDGAVYGSAITPSSLEFETYYSQPFTVAAGTHTIGFQATMPGNGNLRLSLIDAVEVLTAVPPVREIMSDSIKTYLVPLGGAAQVSPTDHNVGSGAFTAGWSLAAAGSALGQDVVWETRVRMVTPPAFWLTLWGTSSDEFGPEMRVAQSYGYDNGGGDTNFDGSNWESYSVGGTPDANTVFAPYDATAWHVWTWLFRKDNTYTVYLDSVAVQSGEIDWSDGSSPLDLRFRFDGTWGRTDIPSVNFPIPATDFDGTYYEWDYSRVYLRP